MLDKGMLSKYVRPLLPIPTGFSQRGKLCEKIRCILFDIYGTLFVSASGDISIAKRESQKIREISQLLTKYGISRSPQAILGDLFNAIEKRHGELREKGIDHPEVDILCIWGNVLKKKDMEMLMGFAAEFEMIVNPAWPMPHLREMLSACRKQNILMGIISNAQFYTPHLFPWFLDSDLGALGFDPDLIFFSYQFGHAKPSAHLFHQAADRLGVTGVPPSSVLYVGNDMLNDVWPAMAVGFRTALFAGDARSLRLREDDIRCKGISADLVITDLMQLVDAINSS